MAKLTPDQFRVHLPKFADGGIVTATGPAILHRDCVGPVRDVDADLAKAIENADRLISLWVGWPEVRRG